MNAEKKRKIAERVQAIAKKHGGRITPAAIIADAAAESSPLHDQFEWDDGAAADKYRLNQARELLRTIRIEVRTETRTIETIAYVRDPLAGDEPGYAATLLLKTKRDQAIDALRYELQRAEGSMHRAREVARALELEDLIDDLIADIREVKQKTRAA